MIITVGGIKGGSGKTTVAINLAVMRARERFWTPKVHKRIPDENFQVLLIDADDQQTAADFTERRALEGHDSTYTCIQLAGAAVRTETLKLRRKYDDIIIDVGGRDTSSQRAALSIADLLLVPFVPRSFDVWTLEKIAELVDEMRQANPHLMAWTFLNRADPRGQDNGQAAALLRENAFLRFVDTPLGTRKAFANAAAEGLGVVELNGCGDEKAVAEMRALYALVFETFNNRRDKHGSHA